MILQLPFEVCDAGVTINMATACLDRIFKDVTAQRTEIACINCAALRQCISWH